MGVERMLCAEPCHPGGGGGGGGGGVWGHAPPGGLKCTCSEVASGGFWSQITLWLHCEKS